jgi:UDP-N-acetylglucosamine/UDP-N-acetylgalactosamine diphosphorylase
MIPVTDYDLPTEAARLAGEELLAQGKIGCLILAGGQGSRLAAAQPKALTPITLIRQKTLLQLFCERGAAAAKAYGSDLPIAMMTSLENHEMVKAYLKQNHNFGVSELDLFQQRNTPFLTEDRQEQIGEGPNGNGEALKLLCESGIGEKWQKKGVEYVMVLPIDNPLADPFDATLCGMHQLQENEATIKAILRTDPHEKVGVVVKKEGKIAVQEYSELPAHFEAPIAHIGLFCFSLSWIEKIRRYELPWHFAHKKYHHQMIWKPEKFLFDVLPFADKVGIVVYPRDETYAPLKNASGDKSLATVQQALHLFDRKLLKKLTNEPLPEYFELDPSIYYLRDKPQKISNYILQIG